jgi:predicted component of type VI protein secretion system
VTLRENVKASTPIPGEIQCRLGSRAARLGSETVIGRSFEEFDSRCEVEFGGVGPEDVRDLLPGGRTRRRIEKFLDFCTPGDIDCRVVIKVERSATRTGGKQYLGYSVFL